MNLAAAINWLYNGYLCPAKSPVASDYMLPVTIKVVLQMSPLLKVNGIDTPAPPRGSFFLMNSCRLRFGGKDGKTETLQTAALLRYNLTTVTIHYL